MWHVTKDWHWKMGLQKTYQGGAHWSLVKLLWQMFRNWKELDNYIYEACEPISIECTSKDEDYNYNEHIVVEK